MRLPVGEIFGLFSGADQLNYREELLVAVKLFLLFQYKPERNSHNEETQFLNVSLGPFK
jgi:hypothetical protein